MSGNQNGRIENLQALVHGFQLPHYRQEPSTLHTLANSVTPVDIGKRKPKDVHIYAKHKSSHIINASDSNPEHGDVKRHFFSRIGSKISQDGHHPTSASEVVPTTSVTEESRIRTIDDPLGLNIGSGQPKSKQIKKSRYRFQKKQQEIPSSDDEQSYEESPGPGYYHIDYAALYSRNSPSRIQYGFGGCSERFSEIKHYLQNESTSQLNIKKKAKKRCVSSIRKIVPFDCRAPKFNENKVAKSPGPQNYEPRLGIEEELIKKIQRSFKGNFGVCQERFKYPKDSCERGPGSYSINSNPPDYLPKGSRIFLSQEKRFR